MVIRVRLIILSIIVFCTQAFAQTSIEVKEVDVKYCLDASVGADNWAYLVDYFESYLVSGDFGTRDNIENAYVKFIEYRTGYPSRKMPLLPDRAELKRKLLEWKIINGQKTYSPLFISCFYEPNKDFETYPKSTLKDVASIGKVLTGFDMSSGTLMSGLGQALKQKDFKKEIYKRALILLSLGEILYIEEFIKEEAGDDNPVYRSIKNREGEKKDELGVVEANDVRLERKPEPDGGFDSYNKWIYDNNEKLTLARKLGRSYRVTLSAVVDKTGRISEISLLRGLDRSLNDEALRLVQTHPVRKWKTGTIGGRPVDVKIEIEVDFRKN